jgi:TolB-like protein
LIVANKPFLVPVVIDETADDDENVPEKFREVQWTRLLAGETTPEFARHIQQLLLGQNGHLTFTAQRRAVAPLGKPARPIRAWLGVSVALAAVAAYVLVQKPWIARPAPPSVFAPPSHSLAVLPFVNMRGDKEQEYFSDGLTEELVNSLARINELQVAASTSSFSFKGKDTDLGTIARKLNVAAVLEGSVRRSPHTVRVTVQLINAATGYDLWSESYDRAPGDVLMLQTEIANAVASALKVTLLSDVAPRLELGETRNPAAFDAYLRAYKASANYSSAADVQATIAMFTEVIGLDPRYALAFVGRSIVLARYAGEFAAGDGIRENFDKAEADARQAMTLAPGLAEGHLALAVVLEDRLEFAAASEEYEKAVALAPGNARVIGNYG